MHFAPPSLSSLYLPEPIALTTEGNADAVQTANSAEPAPVRLPTTNMYGPIRRAASKVLVCRRDNTIEAVEHELLRVVRDNLGCLTTVGAWRFGPTGDGDARGVAPRSLGAHLDSWTTHPATIWLGALRGIAAIQRDRGVEVVVSPQGARVTVCTDGAPSELCVHVENADELRTLPKLMAVVAGRLLGSTSVADRSVDNGAKGRPTRPLRLSPCGSQHATPVQPRSPCSTKISSMTANACDVRRKTASGICGPSAGRAPRPAVPSSPPSLSPIARLRDPGFGKTHALVWGVVRPRGLKVRAGSARSQMYRRASAFCARCFAMRSATPRLPPQPPPSSQVYISHNNDGAAVDADASLSAPMTTTPPRNAAVALAGVSHVEGIVRRLSPATTIVVMEASDPNECVERVHDATMAAHEVLLTIYRRQRRADVAAVKKATLKRVRVLPRERATPLPHPCSRALLHPCADVYVNVGRRRRRQRARCHARCRWQPAQRPRPPIRALYQRTRRGNGQTTVLYEVELCVSSKCGTQMLCRTEVRPKGVRGQCRVSRCSSPPTRHSSASAEHPSPSS